MAKYQVIEKTFHNNELIDPEMRSPEQCVIEWDEKTMGNAGPNLRRLDPLELEAEPEKGAEPKKPTTAAGSAPPASAEGAKPDKK